MLSRAGSFGPSGPTGIGSNTVDKSIPCPDVSSARHSAFKRFIHQVLVSRLIGGAGVVAIKLAAEVRLHGRSVAWVPGTGAASIALTGEQVPWHTYDLDAIRAGTAGQLLACAGMVPRLAHPRRPVVHVHNPVVFRLIRPALVASRARTIVHFQIEPAAEELEYSLRFPPDHVIACARYIAARIETVLASRGITVPVSAIPNFVDLHRFAPRPQDRARERLSLRTDRFVILMLANLAEHKGQIATLRAVERLAALGLPVECWLAGEDRDPKRAYERELRRLCAELKIEDRVRFLGFRSDAPDLLNAADVFLLPSRHEGLPLSLLEAQASGVPVIGSEIPGITEVLIEADNGFIVPSDDDAGLAARIRLLHDRPDVRSRIVKSALESVTRTYSWPVFRDRVFEIYRSLDV
jgi:glycosyltransferase involved in cell wall biosynthesis